MPLTAIALNCTLKAKGESSTDTMIAVLGKAFSKHDVTITEPVRISAENVKTGVTSDEGEGDAWPAICAKALAADILILGTPIWMEQMGSVAKRVLERMDAFLSERDDEGRTPASGKVAVAAIVGNEEGAHIASAQIFQSLIDVGWTIPASAARYWVGEAMQNTDFKELPTTPAKVRETAVITASNAAHLALLLKDANYPWSSAKG